jgi:hypothetical protein
MASARLTLMERQRPYLPLGDPWGVERVRPLVVLEPRRQSLRGRTR